jgi:hypothetical protein
MEPEIVVVDSRLEDVEPTLSRLKPAESRLYACNAPSEQSMRQLGLPPSLISALLERSSAR